MTIQERNEAVVGVMPLVRYMLAPQARRYQSADLDDQRQEALLELLLRSDCYEPALGRFSTFAVHVARHGFFQARRAASTVSLSCRRRQRGEITESVGLAARMEPIAYPDQIDAVAERESTEMVDAAVAVLDAREHKIVVLRFGLYGGEPLTLTEVGDALDLSRERVRQLEVRALVKLRAALAKEIA